jgi:hypothetical protein
LNSVEGARKLMSNRARDAANPGKEKPAGKDDPAAWTPGGRDSLRDGDGGTYGTLPGRERPEQVAEPRVPDDPQQGADVRHEAEPIETTLPAGLVERKGSYDKSIGRRGATKS